MKLAARVGILSCPVYGWDNSPRAHTDVPWRFLNEIVKAGH